MTGGGGGRVPWYNMLMKYLPKVDPEIAKLIKLEDKRQQETLMMIPSENIASLAVEEAIGSSLGNKYAEGYPHRRYYQGQKYVDQVEDIAIERAKKLFNTPHANVQPYSGSPANFAVYNALLSPGQTIVGLSLAFGGHLTHGAPVSVTSKYFKSVQYELGHHGLINFEDLRKLVKKNRPKVIIAGFTAYPRVIQWKKFLEIADEVGAYLLADISHLAGLIAGGAYPSPAPYVHIIMTTTHKTLRGPRGAMILVTKRGLKKDPELAKKIDKSVFPGLQGGPHINTISGIAVALKEASSQNFKKYAKQIVLNAKSLARELKNKGLNLVAGGTDSHLILIDLRNKKILGNTAAEACETVGIVLNRNGVPFDPNPPFFPSGIRLGTPGVTSRGMREKEMKEVARIISETIEAVAKTKQRLKFTPEQEKKREKRKEIIEKSAELKKFKLEILNLCKRFPVKKIYSI